MKHTSKIFLQVITGLSVMMMLGSAFAETDASIKTPIENKTSYKIYINAQPKSDGPHNASCFKVGGRCNPNSHDSINNYSIDSSKKAGVHYHSKITSTTDSLFSTLHIYDGPPPTGTEICYVTYTQYNKSNIIHVDPSNVSCVLKGNTIQVL